VTPKGPIALAFTASGGTSTGALSTQSQFFLGGPSSLRGFPGGVLQGSAFWLGRGEIGTSFPGARATLFTDVGWAGPRGTASTARPLQSVGVGFSVLDGLLRFDLAQGLHRHTPLRLEVYFDGIL
jgi:hemolysin activation/secretion protein